MNGIFIAGNHLKGVVAGEKHRLHKVLDDAGIRLGGVVSDIQGTSAQAMIAGLVAGQPVAMLLDQARGRLKAKREQLAQALDEPLSERHRWLLQEIQGHIRYLEEQIHHVDEHLLAGMQPYRKLWPKYTTKTARASGTPPIYPGYPTRHDG